VTTAEQPFVAAIPDPVPASVTELVSTTVASVSPTPSDAEVVAIMAGVEALWPQPVIAADTTAQRSTAWRFSGRWWAKPVSARRDRPFR
jgi:hypothetical protein